MVTIMSTSNLLIAPSGVPGAGYGVFANKAFQKNETIDICPFVEIPDLGCGCVNDDNPLSHYVFSSHLDKQKCLVVFGHGSMFNHSDEPNADYFIYDPDPEKLIEFVAQTPIEKGQEIFIDYGPTHPVHEMIQQKKRNVQRRSLDGLQLHRRKIESCVHRKSPYSPTGFRKKSSGHTSSSVGFMD